MTHFEEIENARIGRLISIVTKIVGVCAICYTLLIILFETQPNRALRLITPSVGLLFSILSLYLTAHGYIRSAGRIMAILIWIGILLITALNQNGERLAVSGFIMAMLFTSILVDLRWMLGLTVVNVAAHMIATLLIMNNIYEPPLTLSPFLIGILSILFIASASVTLVVYINNLRTALIETLESEALFREMFENSLEAKFLVTSDGTILRANRAATEMYGYTEAEFIAGGRDLIQQSAVGADLPHEMPNASQKDRVRGEVTVKDRNGKPVTIEFTSSHFKTPMGLDQLVISNLDITERKRADEELRQQKELLQSIVDNIPVMIVFFDGNGQFRLVNGEWERTLGYTLEECQNHPDIISAFYPDPDVRRAALAFMEAAPARWQDFDIVTKDGRTLQTSWRNVRFSDGGSIGIGQDVTERREAEQALQQYAERLEIINQIERSIIEAQDPALLARNTLHHVCQIISCERASITLFREQTNRVQFFVIDTALSSSVSEETEYPLNREWFKRLEQENVVITEDLSRIPNPPAPVQILLKEGFQSQVSVALKARDAIIGAVNLTFKSPLHLKEGDLQILQEVAAQLSIALQQTRLYEQVQNYAKELEERVAERTAAMEELINRLPEYIFVVEKNRMEIMFCNDRFAQVSGFKDRHAVQGKTIYECFPPKEAEYFAAQNKVVFDTGETLHTRETLELSNGTQHMDTYKVPLKNMRGDVYALIGTYHDLTDILTLQKELAEASEALRQSEDRYRTVVETQEETICRFLPDTTLTFVNAAYSRHFGKTAEELIGQSFLNLIVDDQREANYQHIQSLVESPRLIYNESHVVNAEGEKRWQRWQNIPIYNDRGEVVEFQGVGIDITEIKEAEEAVRSLNQQLQQKAEELERSNRELESFSYSISHDLRAPLRAIDGFSRILTDNYSASLPEQGQHYLKRVHDNAKRMGTLIDDLLALSRLGRRELRKRPVSPTLLVHQILSEWGENRLNPQAQIEVAEMGTVEGDPSLLRQVYENLISNALKYSQYVNKPIVEVGYTIKDNEKHYFVKDNGVGFDMRYADKLFGVFQRLHNDAEYEGTGIGLAIVQQIIRRHGGRVWVEAELNKGATFYLTLGEANG
jgi:PAS domain S-box-containing protein